MSVILSEALKDPLLTMSQVAQFEIEIARLQGAGMDAESVEYKILPAVRRIVLRAEFGLEREIYL
ncbi:unnamed protein product [Ciceribacter selenitireducens ATCC BAA-1503]|uniref:Uncharacterized protein n=2 Tax=Ciceribacter selenitireducens TaxID=448181 RepID=A0A376AC07_9HYPH|nr:unnamed protein product [Ciceribacter selenitireducens ATCC BAA-1503]